MKVERDGITLEVLLVDDGTLDTVVSVNGAEYRFDSENARDEQGNVEEHIVNEAIDAFLGEVQIGFRKESGQLIER